MVGDDDQSIYAWRGARPENLARLKDDYPPLKVIMLEQNYRSSARILGLANAPDRQQPPCLREAPVERLTAPATAPRVLHLPRRGPRGRARGLRDPAPAASPTTSTFGDIAILYRGNHQARPFEKALREHNVPYFLSGGTSFFARTEVKDLMAYLRLLANPEDDAAFLRVVNTPRREIGPTTLEDLAGYARGARASACCAACGELGLGEHLGERQRERLQHFTNLIDTYAPPRRQRPVTAVRALVDAIDYAAWLRENASSQAVADRRMENVTRPASTGSAP